MHCRALSGATFERPESQTVSHHGFVLDNMVLQTY